MSLLKQHAIETLMEVKVEPHAFLMLALAGSGWSDTRFGRVTARDRIPSVCYAERPQNQSGRGIGEKNRCPTRNIFLVAQPVTVMAELWRIVSDLYASLLNEGYVRRRQHTLDKEGCRICFLLD